MISTEPKGTNARPTRAGIVDCDVHPIPQSVDEIRKYLPMPWKERYQGSARGFYQNPSNGMRQDSRPPSEYLRDHVRLSSQPLENPDDPQKILTMLELLDAEHLLMFSSDYPHWDFDSPTQAFPPLPEELRRRIFSENAREFYGLM